MDAWQYPRNCVETSDAFYFAQNDSGHAHSKLTCVALTIAVSDVARRRSRRRPKLYSPAGKINIYSLKIAQYCFSFYQ